MKNYTHTLQIQYKYEWRDYIRKVHAPFPCKYIRKIFNRNMMQRMILINCKYNTNMEGWDREQIYNKYNAIMYDQWMEGWAWPLQIHCKVDKNTKLRDIQIHCNKRRYEMRKMQIYCKLDRNTVQYHGTDSVQIRYKYIICKMRKIPAPLTRQTADSEALQWLQV